MTISELGRRAYLRRVGGVAGVGLIGGTAAGGTVGASTEREVGIESVPRARPILCDVSDPRGFAVVNHLPGDPASEDRTGVVHATSDGTMTRDYAAGLVHVPKRLDRTVTLGELSGLTYDYYAGSKHEGRAPDEVFLVIQTEDQRERGEADALFTSVDEGREPGAWHTFDVRAAMDDAWWFAITLEEDTPRTGAMVEHLAIQLRDEGRGLEDVVGEYGGDAELLGVGYGVGSTLSDTALDIYYDNLCLTVESEDHCVDFPAVVPMSLSFDPPRVNPQRRGVINADLELLADEEGITLEDTRGGTLRMHPHTEAAPPVEAGVEAERVRLPDGRIRAQFRAEEFDEEAFPAGEQPVLVSGEFDREQVVWFLGEGTLEFRG